MGNSCHTNKKQTQTGSNQIPKISLQQHPQIKSNWGSQIFLQNNLASQIEQRKTPVSSKNSVENEDKQKSIESIQENFPHYIDIRIEEEEEEFEVEEEEDEVEVPQVPNQNDQMESNLNVDLEAKAGEIKERIN